MLTDQIWMWLERVSALFQTELQSLNTTEHISLLGA
jgi:hypothetical protein